MGVFDTLTQPPIECYKPDEKQNDQPFETLYGDNTYVC